MTPLRWVGHLTPSYLSKVQWYYIRTKLDGRNRPAHSRVQAPPTARQKPPDNTEKHLKHFKDTDFSDIFSGVLENAFGSAWENGFTEETDSLSRIERRRVSPAHYQRGTSQSWVRISFVTTRDWIRDVGFLHLIVCWSLMIESPGLGYIYYKASIRW